MYSKRHNLIIGFHGCDESVRDRIVKGTDNQKKSKNDYEWLGNGMYFWEYNYTRALEYAKYLRDNPRKSKQIINKPSVLGAVIDLGYCLDLLDSSSLNIVKEAYRFLEQTFKVANFEMPKNIPLENEKDILIRKLDCAVIQAVHMIKDGEPFDSVRSVFLEGECLYENAGFKEKNHIQICIRNPNCIKGYFIPRKPVDNWDE